VGERERYRRREKELSRKYGKMKYIFSPKEEIKK
jgi:hypothetical protein